MTVEEIREINDMNRDTHYGKDKKASTTAKTALGISIGAGAIALWDAFRGGRRGLGGGVGLSGGLPENININTNTGNSGNAMPTTFDVYTKTCDDALAIQAYAYNTRINSLIERNEDNARVDAIAFDLYKSQTTADFGLYKGMRDGFDSLSEKHNADVFGLYKGQRDQFDVVMKEISDLKTREAVNATADKWKDKVIQMEICNARRDAEYNLERRTCRMIRGEVVLPSTPLVTGFGSKSGHSCSQDSSCD